MNSQAVEMDSIRKDVQAYYGERVQSASASCCGPSGADACCSDIGIALYSADELAQVPVDAAAVSYGCGNPTAIAALRPGEVVLDLGSGGGIDVFLAARQVGEAGFVYGVDMTDEMLELARRNAARQGSINVEFRKGHIEEIPLPDASVDVIISNCVINLSPDKGQTLREAFRVLKPGGRLAVSDVVIDGDLSDLPVTEEQVRAGLSWAGCIAGALTAGQYRAFLADAGFEEIAVDVRARYRWEDMQGMVNAQSLGLSEDLLQRLVDRFTNSDISAQRPG